MGDTPKADTTKAPPKRRKRKASGNTDIKTFLDWWFQAFKNKTGSPYSITGKDASIAKRLLGTYALAALQEYAGRFFCNPGEFAQTAGLTLGVFASQLNKIISAGAPAEDTWPAPDPKWLEESFRKERQENERAGKWMAEGATEDDLPQLEYQWQLKAGERLEAARKDAEERVQERQRLEEKWEAEYVEEMDALYGQEAKQGAAGGDKP